jgi:hypothetical protein
MKLFIDVTSSRRSMQSAVMQRMTKIFAELSYPTVQFTGIRSSIFIQSLVSRRPLNAGVVGRFRIADYDRISILIYKVFMKTKKVITDGL